MAASETTICGKAERSHKFTVEAFEATANSLHLHNQ